MNKKGSEWHVVVAVAAALILFLVLLMIMDWDFASKIPSFIFLR